MIAGRELELAISRASREYRRLGRKVIMIRQHAPYSIVNGERRYSGVGAPADFIGAVQGAPWALEAKMTAGIAFPLKSERAPQRDALTEMHHNGFVVGLVVDFVDHGETYFVGWQAVMEFLARPWRKSLTLFWFRAFGTLLPESGRDTEQRKVFFLDGKSHPLRQVSYLACAEEKAKCGVVSLIEADEELPHTPTPRGEVRTKEQILASLRESVAIGQDNASKRKPRAKRSWGK